MFTVEMDWDETAVTVLDPDGQEEDVQLLMYEDIIYLRQWNEKLNRFSVVVMTPKQFKNLTISLNYPDGSYIVDYE